MFSALTGQNRKCFLSLTVSTLSHRFSSMESASGRRTTCFVDMYDHDALYTFSSTSEHRLFEISSVFGVLGPLSQRLADRRG